MNHHGKQIKDENSTDTTCCVTDADPWSAKTTPLEIRGKWRSPIDPRWIKQQTKELRSQLT